MPYVAAKAHLGLTADCTGLDIEKETNNLLQIRPAIGGNIMAVIKTPRFRPQMSTVRPRSTKPAPKRQGRRGKIIRLVASKEELNSRIERMGFTANEEKQTLSEADTVVVVGRGIKKAENIPLVRELAENLGAALGATRDVVDRGWLSYPHQVGLSGQTINPKLYIGIGVSGSIQHLAGMQTAETIVAINNDNDAPIFKVADFGIVGDLFEVVPILTAHIKQKKNRER
jgi:electron transfer flavoprotein alpha subunit